VTDPPIEDRALLKESSEQKRKTFLCEVPVVRQYFGDI